MRFTTTNAWRRDGSVFSIVTDIIIIFEQYGGRGRVFGLFAVKELCKSSIIIIGWAETSHVLVRNYFEIDKRLSICRQRASYKFPEDAAVAISNSITPTTALSRMLNRRSPTSRSLTTC